MVRLTEADLPVGRSQFLPDGAHQAPADMAVPQVAMEALPAEARAGGKRHSPR